MTASASRLSVALIVGAAYAVLNSACITADESEWTYVPADDSEEVAETSQALTGTHKVCRAIAPNNWQDTTIVPNAWNMGMCQKWATVLGGASWQVGCIFDTGYSWGVNGVVPAKNCGW